MREWSGGSGEQPMDVGAVVQLTKSKKGDKGAGKHKGKTKDAGKYNHCFRGLLQPLR